MRELGRWITIAAAVHLARVLGLLFGLFFFVAGEWLGPEPYTQLVGLAMIPYSLFAPWMKRLKIGQWFEVEHGPNPDLSTELTAERSEQDDNTVDIRDDAEALAASRVLTADAAMASLMEINRWIVDAEANMHLYGFDEELGELSPIYEDDPAPSNSWRPGCGATGVCYETGEFQIALGTDEVIHERWNLTAEQREHYRGLTAVAAVPVLNRAGGILGVISTSSRSDDHGLDGPGARDGLVDAASCVARVFVDLLGWYRDDTAGE